MSSRNNEEIKYGPLYGLNLDLLITHTNRNNYDVLYPANPKKSPKLGPYRYLEGVWSSFGNEDRAILNPANDLHLI